MCEVEDDYSGDLREREKRLGQKCMKCKEGSAVLIIRVGDAFCKSCFKEYFVHKFRATLGKNRVVYPGEKVLLAYSGGPSSSAVIQQVQEGLGRDAPKKLRFVPGIVFIDEGAVSGQSWVEREETVSNVRHVLEDTGFPFHIVRLEEVFLLPHSVLQRNLSESTPQKQNYKQAVGHYMEQEDSQQRIVDELAQLSTADPTSSNGSSPAEFTEQLVQLFTSVKTLTAKQELLHTLRNHLLLHTARSCGYSKIMSGESCTRLAVNLLSNISLGRGAFLPMDTGFSDSRYGDVLFIRPMREYSMKEISFYNRLFNVSSIFIKTLDTKAPENSSIQRLTETFITKLQADFPSTVSTVYRTSEKLNTCTAESRKDDVLQEQCLLCLCPLDTHSDRASAYQATKVSQNLSQRMKQNCAVPAKDSGKLSCKQGQCCEKTDNKLTLRAAGIVHILCYSCQVTMKDLESVDHLPQYIHHEAEHRTRRCEMRKEIQEFLLDDGSDDA
ncbi:cytoplasmic tRNA 2-thiolation protein 2 [Pelobates fuscus]|uniref:cytoplasmic tRNA 2-thiolation protein 2 n=1 Tax=Pelobates fuscus TaxID=191477 RepID=UPI002FE4E9FD